MKVSELVDLLGEKLNTFGDLPVTIAELNQDSELLIYDLEAEDIEIQDGELIMSLWRSKSE